MHEKKIYIIHHGEAKNNDFDSSLKLEGREKVENMVVSLLQTEDIKTCKIMSSEYKRAVETAEIFDKHLNLGFCKDSRLNEINIGSSKENLKEELKKRFECVNSKFEGGESIQQVMERTHQVIRDIINENNKNNYILVTHRITTLLLLHYFDKQFGFDKTWEIASPDAYLIKISDGRFEVEHIKL
ncbi:histidine phosphatase family protein [Bacillus thuringiensis]|uniref:histidine phosphatase family protein n=1 Tax=Bacillus thuringiensis TaxID=1428 RepID=UPI000BFA82D9|nr:histidine phosphatase family protein [Bacillus thuringiensis]PFO98623.1 histidine phosphatase family protein [Bacillus thuringiensis]PGP45875.1 histidine phosphatase family protein [Bacillus thuringiensis]PGY51058.1 histidine phosphatase family protein [Bacillus thuringiensis]